ncbi:MAG: ABC transporter permease [Lentilitoribacter sp.]
MADLFDGFVRTNLWWSFALHEIKQRFRRSIIGPFWMTLSMGIFVAALGFVMSQLFGQDVNWFIPYLATGIIFWNFFTSIVNESCTAFIAAEGHIRNVPMPISVHFYRMIARNVIVWLHNMVIYFIVFLIFQHDISWHYLNFVPGLILFLSITSFLGLILAILSTRYRDIPQMVVSVLQVIFFITPVFWSVMTFPDRPVFIHWNPIYHLLEIVRAPLLGQSPAAESWIVCIAVLFVLIPMAILLYRRAYSRIPYWT